MTDSLLVILDNAVAGTLRRLPAGRLRFDYEPEYQEQPAPTPSRCRCRPGRVAPGPGRHAVAAGAAARQRHRPAAVRQSMNTPAHMIDASGIVGDDVTGIDVVLADGSKVNVPVSENAYSSLIPDTATELEYHTTDQGTLTANVPPTPTPPPVPRQP